MFKKTVISAVTALLTIGGTSVVLAQQPGSYISALYAGGGSDVNLRQYSHAGIHHVATRSCPPRAFLTVHLLQGRNRHEDLNHTRQNVG